MNISMYAKFSNMVLQEGIEKAAEYASRLDFSSVELFADCTTSGKWPFSDAASAEEAKAVLEEYGLTVSCCSAYVNVWQNEIAVKRAIEMLEIVSALGCPYFHHTLLPWIHLGENAPSFEEGIEAAVNAAERIANYAKNLGVTCLYEDQGHYVNGVKGFGVFFNEIRRRCENVGVCGDFGNIMFENEKPEDFLKEYASYIYHVHVKDYMQKRSAESPGREWIQAKGENWLCETIVGTGDVNIKACMKVLEKAGYEGAYALEIGHPGSFEEGVKYAMKCLETWQPRIIRS